MKTWLDAYVVEQNREYEPTLRDHPRYGSKSLLKTAHWNLIIQNWQDEPTEDERTVRRFEREWVRMVTPFLQPDSYDPLCLQVTPNLAEFFASKRVEGWDAEAFELLERHKSIYIDLPHNAFFVSSDLEVRAIVIRDMRHTISVSRYAPNEIGDRSWDWSYVDYPEGKFRVNAIITSIGSDLEVGSIRWTLSADESAIGYTIADELFDGEVFRIQLEEFIKVILAYFLLASRKSQQRSTPINLENADRKERRAYEKDKQSTLFYVVRLSLTGDPDVIILAGGAQGSRKGWKLGSRVHIEPFPRWQWKGKKGERYQERIMVGENMVDEEGRKGFWKGPIDAPKRLKLYSLE